MFTILGLRAKGKASEGHFWPVCCAHLADLKEEGEVIVEGKCQSILPSSIDHESGNLAF